MSKVLAAKREAESKAESAIKEKSAQVDELKTNLELEKQIAAQEKQIAAKDKQVTEDRLSSAVSEAGVNHRTDVHSLDDAFVSVFASAARRKRDA